MNRDDNHMTGDKGAFIYEILLDAICCVMCADKKITTQERKAVHKILHKTKSPWSDEDIDEKIGVFVQRLKKEGSRKIIQETCSRLPEFSKVGKEQILLKCIDYMADADGEIHEEEISLINQFKSVLDKESAQADAPDPARNTAKNAVSKVTKKASKPPKLPVAMAPFYEEKARYYQELTARALGVPVEKSIDLASGVKMEFILIPAGEFMMGNPNQHTTMSLFEHEQPQHRVKISKAFWMGIYNVTQEQYQTVMGNNPSYYVTDRILGKRFFGLSDKRVREDTHRFPVEQVSWFNAVEFCRKLSEMDGKTYRLPTEAEWEYAYRAGTETRYFWGENFYSVGDYAWLGGDATHQVGQKKPNAFGLYDMCGNVVEWCHDWHDPMYYSNSPEIDPMGPNSGHKRVFRGCEIIETIQSDWGMPRGDEGFYSHRCTSSSRGCWEPEGKEDEMEHDGFSSRFRFRIRFGFRIVSLSIP